MTNKLFDIVIQNRGAFCYTETQWATSIPEEKILNFDRRLDGHYLRIFGTSQAPSINILSFTRFAKDTNALSLKG